MDAFYQRLVVRAATIDEVLSDDFEPLAGQKGDAELAARRLAAWCRASASGDWSLFGRRLARDGWTIERALTRLASVRRRASAAAPAWLDDCIWIAAALQQPPPESPAPAAGLERDAPHAFEQLLAPVIAQADARLWSGIAPRAADHLSEAARAGLRHALLDALSGLCAPALYERFDQARKAAAPAQQACGTARYDRFIADMRAGGARRLFEDKPVLLRLIAILARQWIDTSRELVLRLAADLPAIRRELMPAGADGRVAAIAGELSDPHNGGRSVRIVRFEDGARVVYKPKDLRLDAAWRALVERLNRAAPPLELKAARALVRNGYGWSEFIAHESCADGGGLERFFRRAGGWLALFHLFAATDMHQENMIAAGDHPVPIDLETILQAEDSRTAPPADLAFDAAVKILADSVMSVGLLPAYGRAPDTKVFAIGGMTSGWTGRTAVAWDNINSDAMRPAKATHAGDANPNLPQVGGRYAKLGDHVAALIAGFEDYARFLLRLRRDAALFDGFAGLPVRRVIRPTRFYAMLLQRLRNHRAMDDGIVWSAQADFVGRLAEWDADSDPVWPLHHAERAALLTLNVPHFVSPSDANAIRAEGGAAISTAAASGLDRARARLEAFDATQIAWQVEVIRQNTAPAAPPGTPATASDALRSAERALPAAAAPDPEIFRGEADRIANELARHAIRRGPGAAWIGLDWLGHAEVFQLVPLGPDLYNGVSGIAVFLAAHAAVTANAASGELARAAVAQLRNSLKSRSAARMARALGVGGASGLGSIVYALTVMAQALADDSLRADAERAAELFTDDLIAADRRLDVIGGSAGAILALLRLYRDTQSADVLRRATQCGEHLMAQGRVGPQGRRTWVGLGAGTQGLNGMSHGAAGFAAALAALAAATGRAAFAEAAAECIAFEDASYDPAHRNWPDLRRPEAPGWPCQWCHGAPGIGLARIATANSGALAHAPLAADIGNALAGAERGWPNGLDTLCCGTLGSVEFFCEAGDALARDDLHALAARRLAAVLQAAASQGDYRWNSGKRQFNLGLFRGLAGVGYTALRQVDDTLPNVLIWE